jgi:hypothetical protein
MNVARPRIANSDSELMVASRPDDLIEEVLDGGYDLAQHGG